MTPNPVRAHVRRGPERPEAEPEQAEAMTMPTLGSAASCYQCDLVILPGELFFAVTFHLGEPVVFVHELCELGARR